MNSTVISVIVGILLIGGIGGVVYWQKQNSMEAQTQGEEAAVDSESVNPLFEELEGGEGNTATSTEEMVTGSKETITLAELKKHNSRESCWSFINGAVYDLTSWIPKHPGGEQAILGICGMDGSAKFNGKHGGAAKQAAILAGFKIGVLVD